jgi:hypothetical protein
MMEGKYRLCNYKAGETLYTHKDGKWRRYGFIEKKQNSFLSIRIESVNGLVVIREDLLSREGVVSKVEA